MCSAILLAKAVLCRAADESWMIKIKEAPGHQFYASLKQVNGFWSGSQGNLINQSKIQRWR